MIRFRKQKLKKANDSLIIHETPLAEIRSGPHSLIVELDDVNEQRKKICFHPYQAVKITTKDCVNLSSIITPETLLDGKYCRCLWECVNSRWISSLKRQLADSSDNFLKKSKHYILDLGDNLLEVVAWNADVS